MQGSMKPYYQSIEGDVIVYHAPWRDVWACIDTDAVKLIHADPPYGIGLDTDYSRRAPSPRSMTNKKGKKYPKLHGDEGAFDPRPLLETGKPLVLWGANCYPTHLPPSAAWLSWLKRGIDANGNVQSDDGGDSELAWTNFKPFPAGRIRTFAHVWRGLCRASEVTGQGNRRIHPTQKPIALASWVFGLAKDAGLIKRDDMIFVPFGGSMPEIPAALAIGCKIIACDVELSHVQNAMAIRRGVGQGSGMVAAHEAELNTRQTRMF